MAKHPENRKRDQINCDVKHVHGILSDNGFGTKKIYASISWNDREAKDEIRLVKKDVNGNDVVGKGIALTDDEMENLIKAYHKKKAEEEVHKPVDFSQIFDRAPNIVEQREKGYVTKDGAIVLQTSGELAEKEKSWIRKHHL